MSEKNNEFIKLHSIQLEMLKDIDTVCKNNNIQYFLAYGTLLGAIRHNGFIPWDDDVDIHFMRNDYYRFLSLAEKELDKEKYFVQKEFSDNWPMTFSKIRKNNTTFIENEFESIDTHQGVFVDIFPLDNLSDNNMIAYLQFKLSRLLIASCMEKRGAPDKAPLIVMVLNKLLTSNLIFSFCTKGNNNSSRVHCFLPSQSYKKNIFPREIFAKSIPHAFEDTFLCIPQGWDECLKITYGDYMKPPEINQREQRVHAKILDLTNSYKKYKS